LLFHSIYPVVKCILRKWNVAIGELISENCLDLEIFHLIEVEGLSVEIPNGRRRYDLARLSLRMTLRTREVPETICNPGFPAGLWLWGHHLREEREGRGGRVT
jgi:hypothetical protein